MRAISRRDAIAGAGLLLGLAAALWMPAAAALAQAIDTPEPTIVTIDNTGPLATKLVIIVAVLVVMLFAARHVRIGELLRTAVIWIGIFALVVVGYTYRHQLELVGRDVVGVLLPGTPVARGESVSISRGFRGQFVLDGEVGDTPVTFLFDTGASTVVLAAADARRAGFHAERLDYSLPVMTARGMTTVAPVRLSSLSIGSIRVEDVRAAVARPGDLDSSLLGMTFLNRLDGYAVRRDRLILNP
ncbi:TIGR02281 family clan AA aspartic protease [Acuticoccus sp. I52.16.1]|uniref:retropepsin-like aspartic protease family protein n=1 Tax=Acuticoccus sp. I52.16.1 TaxID=2928472 RepID=UPI001FD3C87B|nr:TIGR02281 family clan AA aspartic protease [Acuticoccus sp. I52.16.1]UOM34645.1 TIGR02281 family clan AA aspartic protease [Acuticoccus sp. I52.16.1]